MSDAAATPSSPPLRLTGRLRQAAALPLPRPQALSAPVFVSDAATPLAGGTVLGHLLARETAPDDD